MEGVSAATSVIAVIQLTGSVLKICGGYLREVKNARDDITALQQTVEDLRSISLRMRELLEDTRSPEIASSLSLINSVSGCTSELSTLEKVIDPGKGKDLMRRFGIRAFKWPLHRSEVDKILQNLERYKSSFTLILQVDQTALLTGVASSTARIHWNLSLDRLPVARGAEFDSYMDQHEVECLPGTRTQLLRQVREWARSPQGEYIFWLNGMAGTGKSTISRTVAQTFKEAHILGASFFFKRGEGDRGSALKLFPTITRQLVAHVPQLIPSVQKALDNEPDITGKSLPEQFDKLLLQPIMSLRLSDDQPPTVVLVIDALDECECDDDIRMILQLFPRLRNSKPLRFRIFVTSRPEMGIRLGFSKIAIGEYEDLVLHDIPEPEVAHDISLFLEHRLSAIRAVHSLPVNWPGETDTHRLVKLSIPLFIFAATACRILEDPRWDPVDGLAEILARRHDGSQFDRTYLPVLNQLLKGQTKLQERQLVREFQEVVGAVALLESPLSVVALSKLLGATESRISRRLNSLPSVLNVPNDWAQPVRLFHLSFRDFLLDLETQGRTPFWIDAKEVHQNLTTQCLRVCEGLRKNICELNDDTERSAIDSQTIVKYIPPELQYCCRYWTHHLTQSKDPAAGKDRAFLFLRKHFLHWMEAMSILGYANEVVQRLTSLQTLIDDDNDTEMSEFLHDAKRFVLANRQIADKVPLQIYCSGLLFAPATTIFSREFKTELPEWACQLSQAEETWCATLEVLGGHSDYVHSVAFSPVGQLLASCSYDRTVRLWDSDTGKMLQSLKCHCDQVNSVSFSPDGQVLASGSNDKTIRLWDPGTGTLQQTLEGHSNWVKSIAFSPDSRLLASGSLDQTVRLWKTASCALQLTLEGHSGTVSSIAFSPNGRLVASGSLDETVRLWDVATGTLQLSLETYSNPVSSVAFSPDGRLLVSGHLGFIHNPVRFWDVSTGTLLRTLIGHSGMVKSVAFSPDGRLLASASTDSTVRLWDALVSISQQTGENNSHLVKFAVFSPDGRLLASASSDNKVRIWETATCHLQLTLEGHSQEVIAIAFSSDGRLVASGSFDKSVRLWDTTAGTLLHNLMGHADSVESVTFSADDQLVSSRSKDNTVRLWNTSSGTLQQVLVGHSGWIKSAALTPGGQLLATGSTDKEVQRRAMPVAFSSDGKLLAVGGIDNSVRLQVTATGRTQHVLKRHTGEVLSVVFSPDGRLLASSSTDRTVRVWNTATGALQGTIDALIFQLLTFSPDGRLLASKHHGHSVWFWDVTTGVPQKDSKSKSSGFGSITFSPDRQLLAPGSGTRLSQLLDTSTGDLQSLRGSLYPVMSVSFSPDGRLLASGSADLTVRVWNIITGTLQWSFEGHSAIVESVAYSPDGKLLASGSSDRTILVWDTAKSTLRHTLTASLSVTPLGFGQDSSTLRTDLESFVLRACDINCTPNSLPITLTISPRSRWIMLNGANVLWLPYGYRCVAIHERMLVLLHSSGRLSFIRVRE